VKQIEASINKIKKAGGSYIKVECEGNFDTEYSGDGDWLECDDCCGTGSVECSECGGMGYFTDDDGDEIECECCWGRGTEECANCNGEGGWRDENIDDSVDYDYIYDCIQNELTQEQRKCITFQDVGNDGSVNTEWTFTIPIEMAVELPEYLKAFRSAGLRNIDNAGLHISILNDGNINECSLDNQKLDNFKKEASKLMIGLIASSTPSQRIRGYRFCYPVISDTEKYSAIYTHSKKYLEFRIFHVCYDKPEHIYSYIRAIAGMMKYYSNTKCKIPELEKGGVRDNRELKIALSEVRDRVKLELKELVGIRQAKKESVKVEL